MAAFCLLRLGHKKRILLLRDNGTVRIEENYWPEGEKRVERLRADFTTYGDIVVVWCKRCRKVLER